MPPKVLSGTILSDILRRRLASHVDDFTPRIGRPPGLAVVLVGDLRQSIIYVRAKQRAALQCGFRFELIQLPANISEAALRQEIEKLNANSAIDGIITQLPLPLHINPSAIIESVAPDKDVDGLHPLNVGLFGSTLPDDIVNSRIICPCTALGIRILLDQYGIRTPGQRAVVVGRSSIVGKPTSVMLAHGDATVSVCHSLTENLPSMTREADILVVGVGRAGLIGKDHVKDGAVVVDVGINPFMSSSSRGGGVVGDVSVDVFPRCSAFTPVPGGVGPMTVAGLLLNTFTAYGRATSIQELRRLTSYYALRSGDSFEVILPQ